MIFKQYPIVITRDAEGNHCATCEDLNYSCTIHEMSLAEACGAAMCAIHQLCNALSEQKIPLPDATTIAEAKQSAPENTVLVASVIVARREDEDPNY